VAQLTHKCTLSVNTFNHVEGEPQLGALRGFTGAREPLHLDKEMRLRNSGFLLVNAAQIARVTWKKTETKGRGTGKVRGDRHQDFDTSKRLLKYLKQFSETFFNHTDFGKNSYTEFLKYLTNISVSPKYSLIFSLNFIWGIFLKHLHFQLLFLLFWKNPVFFVFITN